MKLCYVTDRKGLRVSAESQCDALLEKVEMAARAGVDWIQIREKDLSGRALGELVRGALKRVPASCHILVNDRLDAAYASGAAGVHLGEGSLPVGETKRLLHERKHAEKFLVGVSTHSVEAVVAAEKAGADYVIFGPVYRTPSKAGYGPPQGIERLKEVCRSASLPVLAIGGITLENAHACLEAGAAGIAAIRLFQDADEVAAIVKTLRAR
jgi:thiamine-phosphate pyrophosphorylase